MVRFYAPWDQLKTVIVGKSYTSEFYDPIANRNIRDNLQHIAGETEEDLMNLVKVLEGLNIKVYRPEISKETSIIDFIDPQGKIDSSSASSLTLIPRPPMQPRDSILVIGDKIFGTNPEHKFFSQIFQQLETTVQIFSQCEPFDAPLVTVVGNTLIVDTLDNPDLADQIKKNLPEINVIASPLGGHNDAVFCPLRPGLIISSHHRSDYSQSFPGWKIFSVKNQSWQAIPGWRNIKNRNRLKWWVPEDKNNLDFSEFVESWLKNWVGFVGETVFDVNMLQINRETVLVNNYNRDVFSFFKENNITPIITPFRHRFFWDGGVHCITSDVYRDGQLQRYL